MDCNFARKKLVRSIRIVIIIIFSQSGTSVNINRKIHKCCKIFKVVIFFIFNVKSYFFQIGTFLSSLETTGHIAVLSRPKRDAWSRYLCVSWRNPINYIQTNDRQALLPGRVQRRGIDNNSYGAENRLRAFPLQLRFLTTIVFVLQSDRTCSTPDRRSKTESPADAHRSTWDHRRRRSADSNHKSAAVAPEPKPDYSPGPERRASNGSAGTRSNKKVYQKTRFAADAAAPPPHAAVNSQVRRLFDRAQLGRRDAQIM